MIAPLDQLANVGHAGCAQQFPQLRELFFVAVRDDRDQVRALAGPATRPLPVLRRLAIRSTLSLHKS